MAQTGLMTGTDYASMSGGGSGGFGQTAAFIAEGVATIFGQVAANKYVRDLSINYEDVVAEDIHRDNRTLIYVAATALLLVLVVVIITRR